ncbi:tripartite motif-containing protein 59-like [Patella vulgata]|uniref:tripartite motif-containing protein 59-like n=1 Tax=Patella vulgata TaxID=6465 RepID=UPI0024A9B671|nr:tripartite motif-containing protein 59-like [Patella vulgata]
MASNQNCSICFDMFNQPKILPCFHTFCQECLDSYIRRDCSVAVCGSCVILDHRNHTV